MIKVNKYKIYTKLKMRNWRSVRQSTCIQNELNCRTSEVFQIKFWVNYGNEFQEHTATIPEIFERLPAC